MKCDHICSECGDHERGSWFDDVAARLLERQLCFRCDHWHSLIRVKDEPHVVRANGTHYMIGGETNCDSRMRGFGGQKFTIRFNDGREATSTNIWCQGRIPPRFAERLPDNAVLK